MCKDKTLLKVDYEKIGLILAAPHEVFIGVPLLVYRTFQIQPTYKVMKVC